MNAGVLRIKRIWQNHSACLCQQICFIRRTLAFIVLFSLCVTFVAFVTFAVPPFNERAVINLALFMTLSNIFFTFVKTILSDNTKTPFLRYVAFSVFGIVSRSRQTCAHTYSSSVASLLFAPVRTRKQKGLSVLWTRFQP